MLTTSQLKKAVIISEKLDDLKAELAAILGGSSAPAKAPKEKKTKRTMSPEAREKIAAAQRKRWAKQKKSDGKK